VHVVLEISDTHHSYRCYAPWCSTQSRLEALALAQSQSFRSVPLNGMGDTAASSIQMADEQYPAQDDPSSSSSDMQPVRDVLNTWTLSDYLGTKPPSHVVVIPSTMTVANVLKVLATSSILSAPVFSDDDNEFLGFVDIGDLLTYLLGMINVQTLTGANQAYTLRSAGKHARPCSAQLSPSACQAFQARPVMLLPL
jgi:hypothetical protein